MQTLFKTFLLLIIILLTACNQNEDKLNPPDPLIGYWINPEYVDDQMTLMKSSNFNENDYGIAFFEDGTLIERSSGLCGTPPITYSDFEGTWTKTNTTIDMTMINQWIDEIQWDIINLEDDKLVVVWQ